MANKRFLAVITMAGMLLFACQALSLSSQKTIPLPSTESTVPLPASSSTLASAAANRPPATALPLTPTVEPPPFLSNLLTKVQIRLTDSFATLDNWHTFNPGSGAISNGVFILTGQADWGSGVVFNQPLTEGFGVMINFKTEKNADLKSELIITAGDYNADSWRQFGIYNGRNPQTNLFVGKNGIGFQSLQGNFSPVANSWYSLLMAIGKNGELLAVISNPADPTKRLVHHVKMGGSWAGLKWDFLAQDDLGETVYLKEFYLFTFGEINAGNL
jgi:hypothetical protein